MLKEVTKRIKTKVDPSLTEKYKGQTLFKEKYEWALNHVKGRNIEKEIEEALKKDKHVESL
jgi:Na+-transporting NADH:ubiquinone oxidoreductase subunit NqrC